jgi:hypothetical protein
VEEVTDEPLYRDRVCGIDIGKACGAENPVTLCDLGILADQAAEPLPAQNPDVRGPSGRMRTPGRRALVQCPVRP